MLNFKLKEDALKKLDTATKKYKKTYELAINNISYLHKNRIEAAMLLKGVEAYIQNLSNKPEDYKKVTGNIKRRILEFEVSLNMLKLGNGNVYKVLGSIGLLGAEDIDIKAVEPGAIAVGGCGIIAVNLLLGILGPIELVIGGVGAIGGAIYANNKNKRIVEETELKIKKLKTETKRITVVDMKVCELNKTTSYLNREIGKLITIMLQLHLNDYNLLTESDKNKLRIVLNSADTLSRKIGEAIS